MLPVLDQAFSQLLFSPFNDEKIIGACAVMFRKITGQLCHLSGDRVNCARDFRIVAIEEIELGLQGSVILVHGKLGIGNGALDGSIHQDFDIGTIPFKCNDIGSVATVTNTSGWTAAKDDGVSQF